MNAVNGHTPGPWRVCYDGQIDAVDGSRICTFGWDSYREFNEGNNAANARLIAAAPDQHAELLACKQFLEDMHTQSVEWTVAESQVRYQAVCAVLAKATGASA